MNKKLNKRGFTLVELLAVLVILSAIMGIALPSITSSLERNKEKQNESKYKMLESFAEIYVSDHKNSIYNNLVSDECYIAVSNLESEGYLTNDVNKDKDGAPINGYVIFNKTNNSYKYTKDLTDYVGISLCG